MTLFKKQQNESIVYSILRMSQKALMFCLVLIGVGYIGGLIAIVFEPTLAQPLAEFTQIFIPLFQLEIGVYGLGSTLENVQKIRKEISLYDGKKTEISAQNNATNGHPEENNDDDNDQDDLNG